LLPKADQVRGHVLKNPGNFSQDDREAILALYVPARTLHERLTQDNRRYLAALKEVGLDNPETPPIPAVMRRFEGTLTLTFAAAEAGVPGPVLLRLLEKDAELKKALGALAAEGGTVQRGVFEELYPRLERLVSVWREQTPPAGPDAFAGLTSAITAVALDSRGEILLSGDEAGEVRLWRLRDSKAGTRVFRGHSATVLALVVAQGGRVFASAAADRQVILWDVEKTEAIRRLVGHVDKVRTLAFSADGKFLASGGDDRSLLLWSVAGSEKPRVLGRHAGALTALAFSPDGRRLAAADADGTLTVYGVASGKLIASWPAHARGALALAFAPDGKTLASGGADRLVRLWNLAGRELKTLEGHANAVVAVAFSPDGTRLYSGSSRYETPDRVIRAWEVATGKLLASWEGTGKVGRIALAPQANLAATGGPDRELKTVTLP
jgi:WD40 repeat protein